MPRGPNAIYHLDPFRAGDASGWPEWVRHAADLGFGAVLLARPFPGCETPDDLFRYSYETLAPALGRETDAALTTYAAAAVAADMAPMLDLDIGVPDGAIVVDDPARKPLLPTPRGVRFPFHRADDPATAWWDERLARWQALGIQGFRCIAAHEHPAPVWSRLIAEAKRRDSSVRFIASTWGATPEAIGQLGSCGFDFCVSSSCWWDFRAPWLADERDRLAGMGPVLAYVRPPHADASAGGDGAEATPAARWPGLAFAAIFGSGWIVPMGCEFAAGTDAGPIRPDGTADFAPAVRALNTLREASPRFSGGPARWLSSAWADLALFARPAEDGSAIVLAVNTRADRAAPVEPGAILRGFGGNGGTLEGVETPSAPGVRQTDQGMMLDPATAALFRLSPTKPILARAKPDVAEALAAARIAIESVSPTVAGGPFAVKRVVGETVDVEADLIADGHDQLAADLLFRAEDEPNWRRVPMALIVNDRWGASFTLERVGRYLFTIEAWRDTTGTFADELRKKRAAKVPIALEIEEGMAHVAAAEANGDPAHRRDLASLRAALAAADPSARVELLLAPETLALMRAAEHREFLTRLDRELAVDADRRGAAFASWYEIFPRSQSNDESRHGTFDDVIAALPRIRAMGFDVLYFPPIHPIGRVNRKGRNNSLKSEPGDPGSPYAIGAAEGGHDAIHPELGTIDDFLRLVAAARDAGLELAIDFAVQCAPDHPWIAEHPDWFRRRADGSIRYAENPPKKYEDIVNVDFYADAAKPSLWLALRDVVLFWAEHGVRIFRVDNPHTKPLPFWEWMIRDIRTHYPDAIFLAEAFTRPKLMYRLAKLGFTQSYTYFTWRNTADELRTYLTELTQGPPRDFFRPHFFVNTPDINPVFLQTSGRAGFLIRAALAATLSGLWGVYNGFELCEAAALPGREEYADSEKYQLRAWDHQRPGNIISEITTLNRIRAANPALHDHRGVEFLPVSNEQVLYYARTDTTRSNVLLIAISMDPHHPQDATIELPLWRFGLDDNAALAAEDLMRGTSFVWHGKYQPVRLDPQELPVCIWRVHP